MHAMSEADQTEGANPPDCCDMRGLLTFQILWELRGKNLNGQEIAERIAERRGAKPTPGTIYPALKELREKRLISGEKVGREIIYSLTDKGEKGAKEAAIYFFRVFGDIVKEIRTKVIVVGDKPSGEPKVRVVVLDESQEK
jgi:DNA-binding PadR family transcriptional regulator